MPGALLSTKQRALKDASFGMSEYNRNLMMRGVESDKQAGLRSTAGYAEKAMNLSRAEESREKITSMDESLRYQKSQALNAIDRQIAEYQTKIEMNRIERFRRTEDKLAELQQAGLSNVVGAIQTGASTAANMYSAKHYNKLLTFGKTL